MVSEQQQPITITYTEETTAATFSFRSDGIVVINVKKNAEIDIDRSKETFNTLKKHVESTGTKALVLVIPHESATVTKEAREFSSSDEASSITIAEAIIIKSIAQRLIINFTLKFYKPKRAMKMFTDESEAVNWLYSFKD